MTPGGSTFSNTIMYAGKFFFSCHVISIVCSATWERYHVPRSWFKPSGNVLVILEEVGGDPTKVTFSKRKISTVWSYVAEDYPSINLESWKPDIDDDSSQYKAPRAHLKCPDSTKISAVNFASFGNPVGSCGSYSLGDCHDPSFKSVVEKVSLALLASYEDQHYLNSTPLDAQSS